MCKICFDNNAFAPVPRPCWFAGMTPTARCSPGSTTTTRQCEPWGCRLLTRLARPRNGAWSWAPSAARAAPKSWRWVRGLTGAVGVHILGPNVQWLVIMHLLEWAPPTSGPVTGSADWTLGACYFTWRRMWLCSPTWDQKVILAWTWIKILEVHPSYKGDNESDFVWRGFAKQSEIANYRVNRTWINGV